jgi:hypothetical protein
MNRTVSAFACVALGCISLAALAVGGTVMVVGHHTLYSLAELDATLREVNRPCGKNQSCGTLADVAKSLNTVRGTFGQIEVAANHENKQLTKLDAQEAQLFAGVNMALNDTHATLTAGTGTLNALTETLGTAKQTIANAQPLEDAATKAVNEFSDTTAAISPRIQKLLDDSGPVMTNVQAMTFNGNRVIKDAADEADKLVHPPIKKLTFWGAIDATVSWMHSRLMPSFF